MTSQCADSRQGGQAGDEAAQGGVSERSGAEEAAEAGRLCGAVPEESGGEN